MTMPTAPKTFRLTPSVGRQEKQWRSRQSESRGWYQTATWKALRLPVLVRDGFQCQECKRQGVFMWLKEHTTKDDIQHQAHIDHVTPHRGDWEKFIDMDNLEAKCARCHSRKTAATDGGFGNG